MRLRNNKMIYPKDYLNFFLQVYLEVLSTNVMTTWMSGFKTFHLNLHNFASILFLVVVLPHLFHVIVMYYNYVEKYVNIYIYISPRIIKM